MKRFVIPMMIIGALMAGQAGVWAGDAMAKVYVPRLEEAGRLLVEMRAPMQLLGYTVTWTAEEERVDAVRGELAMTMWMDEPEVLINDESVMLDVPPRLLWGRTFVPLRFVAEAVGGQVEYLGDSVMVSGPMGDLEFIYTD